MKKLFIVIMIATSFASCQDEESSPTGTAYSMSGLYSVVYSPTTAPTKYVTLTVQPLSANRGLLIYNPYTGSSGQQSIWLWPNDTIDFQANGVANIGPDTFLVNGTRIVHKAVGTYTQNTITFPQHRHTTLTTQPYTYYARIEATK